MTNSSIRTAKIQGFEMAREIVAKEGKPFAAKMVAEATPSGEGVAFWTGFANAVVGMTAAQNVGA